MMSWFGGPWPTVTPNWEVHSHTIPGFCRSQGFTSSVELAQVKHFVVALLFYLGGVRLFVKLVLCGVLLPLGIQKLFFLAFQIFLPLVEP